VTAAPRHFVDLTEVSAPELRRIIDHSRRMKADSDGREPLLSGKILAMIFDKPSTRTRVSFDVAMRQLGGETIFLTGSEMQLGRGESIADTARVLSRYVDAIMIRANSHATLLDLAEYAAVPVINGLTDKSHPCQVMADIMTFEEHMGPIKGRSVAWVGDGNNVAVSWMHAAVRFGFELRIATPEVLRPEEAAVDWGKREKGAISYTSDAAKAVRGVDCVVTDTWVSMGQTDAARRKKMLEPYAVDAKLMSKAADDAIFMHCLPAYRGKEVTADVIDGRQSVVFDEAENRLHAQKAILAWCLGVS
jgi:ornithine carbamoyltransferase